MIDPLLFSLNFKKFNRITEVNLSSGLHLVYGGSGVGKSQLVKALGGVDSIQDTNFSLRVKSSPNDIHMVFQNPDHQIIAHTIEGELGFSLECTENSHDRLIDSLNRMKDELPFVADWKRHPATLSGGEKEILNLITAFSTKPQLVLIDDGLSFLNSDGKEKMISFIRRKIEKNNCIVMWLTSECEDLMYGDTAWELELDRLEKSGAHVHQLESSHKYLPGKMEIKMESLSFSYPGETPLFNQWTTTVPSTRCLGLIGKNGRGKTTLANLLTRVYHPQKGSLSITRDKTRPTLAYLDQFPERLMGADSLQNFMDVLVKQGKLPQYLVKQCIKSLNHHHVSWEHIRTLSALDIPWSVLRFGLFIMLAHCTYDILILDEPTFGLGETQKVILSRFLIEILKKKHVIMISHDFNYVEKHCDGILNLDDRSFIKQKDLIAHA